MRRGVGLAFGLAFCFAVVACLMDLPGVVPEVVPAAGDASSDVADQLGADGTSGDANDLVPPVRCEVGVCGAPTGWTPVLFATNRGTPCPQGATAVDLLADPGSPATGACSCTCSVTQAPPCVPQGIQHYVDVDPVNLCAKPGSATLNVDGKCDPIGGLLTLSPHWRVAPLSPLGPGTCTGGQGAADLSAVPTTPSRLCVDPTCASTCAAPAGFLACVMGAGDSPCPAGLPNKHSVGTSLSVACAPCSACSFPLDAGCGGTLTLYADHNCGTKLTAVDVGGACTAMTDGISQPQVGAYWYTPGTIPCQPGTASVAAASFTQAQTVCCP